MSCWDDEDHDLLRRWADLQRRRPEVDWIEELLSKPPASERPRGHSLVDEYLQGRAGDARDTVQELERELYVRGQLHAQSTTQLDYQITQAARALEQFRGWAVGYNRGVDEKRIELERTLRELRREKRATRVRAWDDLVRLRAELRERRREYFAAARRARQLG